MKIESLIAGCLISPCEEQLTVFMFGRGEEIGNPLHFSWYFNHRNVCVCSSENTERLRC